MKDSIDYWFTVEPYVFIDIKDECVLLFNTLDRTNIESDKKEVIELLHEMVNEKNCGVVLLTNERYLQKDINDFIRELRYHYMGDIIDVSLSKGKPIQLLPYYNFPNKQEIYKKHNFSSLKNVLEYLSEINIHVDATTNVTRLTTFLPSIPGNPTINIIGNIKEVLNYNEILSYFNQNSAPKNMICSYKDILMLQPAFENNFSYRISIHFPIDMQQWENTSKILSNQTLPVEYIFGVTSDEDILKAGEIIKQFQIEKYELNPVYTGNNIRFFEENVFLTKEDILATSISIKDFFTHQAMNIYDFGKINILPNGDAYANLHHPALGNVYADSIYEIVYKEVEEGKSWFRIRTQKPCTNCVYQWLCPSPSDYEIAIGRPNLCHVKR